MIKLSGLHLLLTYQCTFECDHCFAWGSPFQNGTMTIKTVNDILTEAKSTTSVEWIYFEGGEPFLYYQTMLEGVNRAAEMGFKVGIVTNSYWATSEDDALLWLSPLAGKVTDLSISSDLFHFSEKVSQQSRIVTKIAQQLAIPLGVICIEQPQLPATSSVGQLPPETSSIMFRGRAADKLAPRVTHYPAGTFTSCPHEDLRDPGRVHVDALGNLHICQGITLGNILDTPINEICQHFEAEKHPIIGPLLEGGPSILAATYGVNTESGYADACHLCYETRKALRTRFPDILNPDQMYGIYN